MVVVEATHCSTTPPLRYPTTPLLHFSNSPFLLSPALSLPDGGTSEASNYSA